MIKKCVMVLFVVVSVMCVFAQAATRTSVQKKRKGGLPSGGFIEIAPTGKVVQVYNNQTLCPKMAVGSMPILMKQSFGFPVEYYETSPVPVEKPGNVAARIIFVADDASPALLTAPEEGWAQVNVKKLAVDNPDQIKLEGRTLKEAWRALGYALGCGNSATQPCVMSDVASLKDLDESATLYGPEARFKVEHTAKMRGVDLIRYVSYRVACKQGWAAEPTNEVQRVIWEEYHAKPTEPMTIKFDPKKGK